MPRAVFPSVAATGAGNRQPHARKSDTTSKLLDTLGSIKNASSRAIACRRNPGHLTVNKRLLTGVESASAESVPGSDATGGGTGVVTSSSEAAKKAKNAAAKNSAAKKAAKSSAAGQVNPAATIATAGRRLLEVPSL